MIEIYQNGTPPHSSVAFNTYTYSPMSTKKRKRRKAPPMSATLLAGLIRIRRESAAANAMDADFLRNRRELNVTANGCFVCRSQNHNTPKGMEPVTKSTFTPADGGTCGEGYFPRPGEDREY